MRELTMDIGRAGGLKNEYNHPIKVGHANKGYFIILNDLKKGPYSRVFLDKINDDLVLIGYSVSGSELFRIDKEGLTLIEKLNTPLTDLMPLLNRLNKLVEESNKELFANCKLLGKIGYYSIFLDGNNKFFAVDTTLPLTELSKYSKFEEYEDLLAYYKEKGIDLYSNTVANAANKLKRNFVKFEDLYTYISSLTLEELPYDMKMDIVAERNMLKDVFNKAKKATAISVRTDEEANELIEDGYYELKHQSIEKISQSYPTEFKKIAALIEDMQKELKDACTISIKEEDAIDFKKLNECMEAVSMRDLPVKAHREFSARKALNQTIFSCMLNSCFEKLSENGIVINEAYTSVKNFRMIYPEEFEELWRIALNKMPDLTEEYIEVEKEKFANIIKNKL